MPNTISALSASLSSFTGMGPLFNLNIPSLQIGKITLIEGGAVSSIGQLANKVTSIIGDINQLVNTAYCIGSAITNPAMLMNILNQIGGNLMATALGMAERITSVLEGQIEGLMSKVSGTILNVVSSILSFASSILGLVEGFKKLFENLKFDALDTTRKFMSQEQCEFMLAQMAMCMLNKLFGSKLEKFEKKVTSKITEKGQSLNSALSSSLADTNSLANYVKQESFMVDKATAQLAMLTN